MTNEIKEIKEPEMYITPKTCKQLLDYITNLQEENEKLLQQINNAIHLINHNDIYDYRVFEEMLLDILLERNK